MTLEPLLVALNQAVTSQKLLTDVFIPDILSVWKAKCHSIALMLSSTWLQRQEPGKLLRDYDDVMQRNSKYHKWGIQEVEATHNATVWPFVRHDDALVTNQEEVASVTDCTLCKHYFLNQNCTRKIITHCKSHVTIFKARSWSWNCHESYDMCPCYQRMDLNSVWSSFV